jgi:signal transduction histidine kinase
MLDQGSPLTVALFAAVQEDHDLVAALLSQYQRSRFEIEVFGSAKAARAAVAQRRHDAYVADAALLEEDAGGIAAGASNHPQGSPRADPARSLFSMAVATGRPLIVLADEDLAANDEDYVAAGAWDCLVKFTLTPPVLARTLRRGIEHGRQRTVEHQRRDAHKMEALARLAGGVAHDFNNLLTAMMGYAEMLRESLDPQDPRREDVMEIQRAGERASALTTQLLTFGRRSSVQPAPLDLNAALDRLESRLASVAGKGIEVTIDRGPDVGRVRLDPARLETLLAALVSNSRDAMPQGGVVRIETRLVDLGVSHAPAHSDSDASAGPHVRLTVADEGSGMTAEARSHLFEPFFTTKGKGRGRGLGLPLVYGIVRQARGHIEIDSEPVTGTRVSIYWPAA